MGRKGAQPKEGIGAVGQQHEGEHLPIDAL